MEKYQNRYRIPSARLSHWDYSSTGAYFITICTKNQQHFFGKIPQSGSTKVQYNLLGRITIVEWLKTIPLRPDTNITLGEFILMPNHFHSIIQIGNNQFNTRRDASNASQISRKNQSHTSEISRQKKTKNEFGPQSQNLASIIRGFKSAVTSKARQNGYTNFAWQPRFYDVIIRNTESYNHIENYIKNNPVNWQRDKFYH